MRVLVSHQRRIIEQSYFSAHPTNTLTQTTPLLNPNPLATNQIRTPRKDFNEIEEEKQPIRLTVRAVLAAKRFGKQVLERRRLRQRTDLISVG